MCALNVQLTYKNTFIDVMEDSSESYGTACSRARSAPPCSKKYIQDDEVREFGYVGALMQRADQLKLLARAKATSISKKGFKMDDNASSGSVSTALEEHDLPAWLQTSSVDLESVIDETETVAQTKLSMSTSPRSFTTSSSSSDGQLSVCNPGSAGHPELCRRPCMFAAAGNCESGANCNFCHLNHKNQNLDKRLREQLRNLDNVERFSLMSSVIRERVQSTDSLTQMSQVLEIFKEWEASLPLVELTNMSRLRKALTKLPLSILIGHSMGKETESNAHFHARLRDAMNVIHNTLSSKAGR